MRIAGTVLIIVLCVVQTSCVPRLLQGRLDVNYDELAEALREFGIGETAFDRHDPLLLRRAIVMQGDITFATVREVIQKLFYLEHLDTSAPIHLYLNATGGEFGAVFALINMMKRNEPPVDVIVMGWCFSVAPIVVIAATGKRYAYRQTMFAIHAGSGRPEEVVRRGNEMLEHLLREKTQLPMAWFPLGKELRVFSAQEALEYGVIDGILDQTSRTRP